ncbi:MAG TPA: hypothetical protein PLN13_06250 [Bacteroidia bacterium]|nr:hypothetical protein [Bacteroidia bacterium]HRH08165.1 hypothetical protein [Bacteroidia bacterium]
MKASILVCQFCRKDFTPSRSDAKFCSGACKQKAYNRRIKDTILKYGKNCSEKEKQKIDMLNELECRVNKILEQKAATATQLQATKINFDDFMAQVNIESEKRNMDFTNQRLKVCLIQIMDHSKKEKVAGSLLRILLNSINRKMGSDIYPLPHNYKYRSFILNWLLPSLSRISKKLIYVKEHFIHFELSDEIKLRIEEILKEIG